ncbi:signal recognition particle protein [Alphaproteobacteria bacterium]|jgi:signal recognition particle subunit SRP54|nr:signal recognition particle protein [Alphaproteobacteria bacterium]MDC0967961.1 signal recognition particle protein [Alphaproteobacteria bacterium]|tara:strand:+ start:764 stop:2116 length:1353 start_codon:yes stop_codon:yes gene_type:complete
MLENITNKITGIFQGLSNKGAITEKDLETTLREVRVALLEADVSLKVSKDLIKNIQEKALGQKVIENVQPGQQIIKIVSDELTEILGSQSSELNVKNKPSVFLMCGLQGAGKTTSVAKLAHYCQKTLNKNVSLVSTDLRRPAAIEQLRILAKNNDIQFIEPESDNVEKITQHALSQSEKLLSDILIIDTSGRISTDDELLQELKTIYNIAQPQENLLVLDSLMGQQALSVVESFHEITPLSGFILTRLDADPRGGVALSAKYQTGLPIRFFGSGENVEDFEVFHPDRIASRILGMGDVISLVEKAQKDIDEKEMEALQSQMMSGRFSMNDLLKQFLQMKKMGGMSGMMSYMPGVSKIKSMMENNDFDEKVIDHQMAIIRSMTKKERSEPDILKASRKKRIASGSGRQVHEVNRLLKQFEQTKKLMKQAQKPGFANKLKNLLGGNQMPTIE